MAYSTVQYSTVQYSTVQYSTVQYSTVQYSTVQYSVNKDGERKSIHSGFCMYLAWILCLMRRPLMTLLQLSKTRFSRFSFSFSSWNICPIRFRSKAEPFYLEMGNERETMISKLSLKKNVKLHILYIKCTILFIDFIGHNCLLQFSFGFWRKFPFIDISDILFFYAFPYSVNQFKMLTPWKTSSCPFFLPLSPVPGSKRPWRRLQNPRTPRTRQTQGGSPALIVQEILFTKKKYDLDRMKKMAHLRDIDTAMKWQDAAFVLKSYPFVSFYK